MTYSASKPPVSHVTRLVGVDLGRGGIRVRTISPGVIATPILWGGSGTAARLSADENQGKLERLEQILAGATPLARSGDLSDVAHAALFLASGEAGFVNCQDLVVDGGGMAAFHEAPPYDPSG